MLPELSFDLEFLSANHTPSAASAIAGNTFLRSLAGAGFPLFATYMFKGMGIEWASTLLGCVAAALIPIPVIFYLYGHKIRQRSSFAPTAPPLNAAGAEDQDGEKDDAANEAARGNVARKDQQSLGNGV